MSKLVGDKFGLYPKPEQFELPKKKELHSAIIKEVDEFWQTSSELLRDWRAYAKDKENEAAYWKRKYNKLKNNGGKPKRNSNEQLRRELGLDDFVSNGKYGVVRK